MYNGNVSFLKCIGCGYETDLLLERKFLCPHCGSLYDVEHNFDQLRFQGISAYKQIFDNRCRSKSPYSPDSVLHRSGVWRFHELIMPGLDVSDIVSWGEGIVPFVPAGNNVRRWVGGNLDLWFHLQGLNPTGSFKDMGGTVAISVAKKGGIKIAGCASTGDTSAMGSAGTAAAGMKCVVFLPKDQVTDVQISQPLAYGARIIFVPGSFDDCWRLMKKLIELGLIFPINSFNPTRIEGHQATVFLTYQFFGWERPDIFVVPIGNGSNSSSIGKGMRLMRDLGFVPDLAKIIGVQSEAANPLAASWEEVQQNGVVSSVEKWKKIYKPRDVLGDTTATAARIGNPVSWEKVMREVVASEGAVLTAQERDLNEAVMVAGRDGHGICPQTGTALAGLRQAVERGLVKKGAHVVVVSTATGIKFPNVPVSFGGSLIRTAKTCELAEVMDLMQ